MQNLYDFLREVLNQAENATPGAAPIAGSDKIYIIVDKNDVEWLQQYLQEPETDLHFKAREIGNVNGEPMYAQDYAVKGTPVDIHSLITEAMLQNHQFADIVVSAAGFYREHVPKCPDCSKRHFSSEKPVLNWEFQPHKTT